MKCLVKVLGLNEVFNSKAKWRCGWCKVTNGEIGNFAIERWELRRLEEMKKIREREGKNSLWLEHTYTFDNHLYIFYNKQSCLIENERYWSNSTMLSSLPRPPTVGIALRSSSM